MVWRRASSSIGQRPRFIVPRASLSFCAALAGLSDQITSADLLPPMSAFFVGELLARRSNHLSVDDLSALRQVPPRAPSFVEQCEELAGRPGLRQLLTKQPVPVLGLVRLGVSPGNRTNESLSLIWNSA